MVDANYLIWAGLAAALVGLSKGGLPTVGMLSVPLLSLFMSPVKAVVMLLPIDILSDMVGPWLYRKNFSATNLKILVPAGVGGVFVGWLTASLVSDTAVKMMTGLMGASGLAGHFPQVDRGRGPRLTLCRQPAALMPSTGMSAMPGQDDRMNPIALARQALGPQMVCSNHRERQGPQAFAVE
jgi:uncharacterized membrane protein YfcA